MFTFIELPTFASVREKYLDDEELADLQAFLVRQPEAGDLIPGSGGCRKLRWSTVGRGKQGGIRVIYFLRLADGGIVLVTLYAKNVRSTIEPRLLKRLREVFENGQIE